MNESSQANEVREDESAASMDDGAPAAMPGRFLREARETSTLTVFEVAQSLKFSSRQIEALEADDYAALPPGATFLRGFVRSYAKLLKLDPTPLLAMLDVHATGAPPDVRAPQNMGVAATPMAVGRRSSRPMLLGSAALGVLALVLAVWHYWGKPDVPSSKLDSPVMAPGDATSIRAPDVRVEQMSGAEEQTQLPTAAATPADQHQLVFVFHDKSWVEVIDAQQRVIFSAENAPGTRQAVVGQPPFQIVIGNAAKVELQYDDHQVDLKPHTRAEVARLTLQ